MILYKMLYSVYAAMDRTVMVFFFTEILLYRSFLVFGYMDGMSYYLIYAFVFCS